MGRRPPSDLRGRIRLRLKLTRRFVSYWLMAAPGFWLIEHLPLALVRGFVFRVVEPIVRRATRERTVKHLELALGDELDAAERERIAREVAHNFAEGVVEVLSVLREGPSFYADRLDDEAARQTIAVHAAEHERGFIGLTGHIGNWELMGQWLARNHPKGLGAVIAKRMTNPWLNARVARLRRGLGLETFYRDDDPRKPLRMLRDGQAIATVPDQDVRYLAGVFVDFFGRPAYTPIGPARLALAADVPIRCGYLLRRPGGRFELVVGTPIVPDKSRPREEEIERLTRAWSADVERVIRANLAQWAWFHERWRTTPERLEQRGQAPRARGGDGTDDQSVDQSGSDR